MTENIVFADYSGIRRTLFWRAFLLMMILFLGVILFYSEGLLRIVSSVMMGGYALFFCRNFFRRFYTIPISASFENDSFQLTYKVWSDIKSEIISYSEVTVNLELKEYVNRKQGGTLHLVIINFHDGRQLRFNLLINEAIELYLKLYSKMNFSIPNEISRRIHSAQKVLNLNSET